MKSTILSLCISIALAAGAQTDAEEAITQLKDGFLIVKLIEQEKKIDLLLKQGKKEEAIAEQKRQQIENEALVVAFSEHYTFSKLLFIKAKDIGQFIDGDPSVLFDANGNVPPNIPINYLFIELSESPEQGVDGFVVRDRNQNYLSKPFPYFVTQWDFFHLNKVPFPKMISKWEKKLNSYYSRLN